MSTSNFKSIEPLTADQIAQFKRDGFLVLGGVLDPELCRQARDEMWDVIQAHLPRMKRDDPSTWGPITEEENAKLQHRPEGGGDPYFSGNGHRYTVRNGASELMLNLAPRALWQVAEQLLGKETVVWPTGLDKSGYTTGPCFMCDDAVGGLNSHVGHSMGWSPEGTFTTEPELRLPETGPVWLNGQGTRGLYCTLPNSPSHAPEYRGAHSDGACYGRWRLQMSAYISDVPPNSGGFTVWPGSHARIWPEQWKAFKEGEKHTDRHLAVRKAGGYTDPVIGEIKADTEPFDCHGPTGTVVLWHTKILHIAGQNASNDVIRQATIYGFQKTPESVPDAFVMDNTDGDIWRDWSDEVRA
ncbi:phytanoyl-CoA dioxygenase family protein [Candidatus Poribacteria bacterium]|nr:phytanoyl-CoA dioxygenase family protein [Candidatus Poribacteria bacterium]